MAPSADVVPPPVTLPGKGSNGHTGLAEDRYKANELRELTIAAEMQAPDVYIDSEKDTPWFILATDLYMKILRLENRSGAFVIVLKAVEDTELGKHRHRGQVRAYTVSGNWGYHEYSWLAKAGDYITENPGTIHSLFMRKGAEVVFDVLGSIEYFNEDNSLREIQDSFSVWRMYLEHCEKQHTKPNTALWY